MAFATKLKQLRVDTGSSLQQIADAIGVSKAHVWELETGKSRNPSFEVVVKLAKHFEKPISEFVGESPDDPDVDEEVLVLFRDLKDLLDDDRDLIKAFLDTLKKRRQMKRDTEDRQV